MATETEAVAKLTREGLATPQTMIVKDARGTDREIVLLPNGGGGFDVHSTKGLTDDYLAAPERREGTAVLTDLPSFVAHANRFKDDDSAIFASRNPEKPSILAVLDYHRAGADGSPRFGKHRARYDFPLSVEWQAWQAGNGKAMGQEDFARFLEDRLVDVLDPKSALETAKAFAALLDCGFATPSRLLELSRGLSVSVGRRVVNQGNLSTGESTMTFAEEHTDSAGKPLKIPGAFLIGIPVFRNGTPYQIPVRLRYRVSGSVVSWIYEMSRIDAVFDHAIDEAIGVATKETSLTTFSGSPE